MLFTYGKMGSPPWENSVNPEEEYAERDNGSAPHEEEPHVQAEAGKTPQEDEAGVEGEAEDTVQREAAGEVNRADESAAARCCKVNPAEGSDADLAEISKRLKVPFFPLIGLLGRITASYPRVIFTVDAWPAAPM